LPVQRNVEVLTPRDRLESWKEIAAYLNRSERTVRRWEERESLPVHRLQHEKRGSVYAYTWELDAWRDSRRQLLESEPVEVATPDGAAWTRLRGSLIGVVGAMVVGAGVAGWWLTRAGQPTSQPHAPNPEAVRAIQKAQFGANAGRAQIKSGIHYYEEAVRIDPSLAGAWSGLATAHVALTWFGDDPASETMGKAKHEAQEALKLDPGLGSAWRVLAAASHFFDFDQQEAERQYLKAIELAPNDAVTRSWYGDYLFDLRRLDEALVAYKKSEDANPRWLEPITFAGNVHSVKGNYDMALVEYRRALDIEPAYGLANHFMGRTLLAKEQHGAAVAQLRKSNDLLGRVPFSMADLGYALAISGQRTEAEHMLADLMSLRDKSYYPAFAIAEIHVGLGHKDQAMDWLERALDERNLGFYFPSTDPFFESLWNTPRFRKLMDRAHVATAR